MSLNGSIKDAQHNPRCVWATKGQNRAKSHTCVTDILKKKNFFFVSVKRAGRHFDFFKRAGRHEKGAGRRALQKKPRQNTDKHANLLNYMNDAISSIAQGSNLSRSRRPGASKNEVRDSIIL